MGIVVPQAEQEVSPDVVQAPRVSPAADAETFGYDQQVPQATRQLLSQAGEIAAFQKVAADQTAVQDATGQLSRAKTSILYDPQNGVMAKQGKDAFGAPEDAMTQFKKAANDIVAKSIHGPGQKAAFNHTAIGMMDEMNQQVQAHVGQQIKVYDNQTFKALLDNEQDAAALAYGSSDQINASLNRQKAAAQDYAKRNGLGDEQIKALNSDITTDTHAGIIERMLTDQHDVAAKAYYDANKDEIDAKTQDKLSKALKEGSLRGESQRQGDQIWSDTGGDLREALQKTTDIQDPELRDRTRQRIKQFAEDDEMALHHDQERAYLSAANLVDQQRITDPQKIRDAIPPTEWETMTPEHRTALLKRSEDVPNDDQKWLDFLDLAKRPDKLAELSKGDFESNYWASFDKSHRERAETMWEASSRGDDKAIVPKQVLDATVLNTGIIPGFRPGKKLGNAQAQSYAAFEQSAADEVQNWQTAHNKKADPQETQQILDGIVLKNYFQNQKPGILTQATKTMLSPFFSQNESVPYESIPDNAREAIVQAARRMGSTVSKDKISRAYYAASKGDDDSVAKILKE